MNTTFGLICPICQENLHISDNSCTCGKHNFDISKESYLNLTHNRTHSGDDKDMITSRRTFLDAGYYQPISDMVNTIISKNISNSCSKPLIVDMGCGEGYYLNRLFNSLLNEYGIYSTCYGLDLSKPAIKIASKKYKPLNWLVANLSKMPFKDSSVDVAISMFANLQEDETIRILKSNGYLLLVRAGLSHLLELRQIIYPKIIERYSKTDMPKGFKLISEDTIKFKLNIQSSEQIKNLLTMTPHYWKVSKERRELLYSMDSLNTIAEVEFYLLQKI